MRLFIFFFMSIYFTIAAASDVPKEFFGDWVPQAATCQSSLKFRVEPARVMLLNGDKSKSFGDLDICYSCEGGAKYNGRVVWLMPESHKNSAPFTVRFNADEKRGITKLDIQEADLKRQFPLHDVALKRCK